MPQQREPAVEQGGDALNAVCADPAGGKLDRERDAIQLRADLRDDRRV
jgi:hypothetical protein